MKFRWVYGTLLAAAVTVSAYGQVSVYIHAGPPPLRIEQRGPEPGPGYAWVDGYWAPNGNHYRWVAGRWDHPPYEGATWSHAHYDHYQQGWQLHEGHWDHDDHHDEHHDDHHDH